MKERKAQAEISQKILSGDPDIDLSGLELTEDDAEWLAKAIEQASDKPIRSINFGKNDFISSHELDTLFDALKNHPTLTEASFDQCGRNHTYNKYHPASSHTTGHHPWDMETHHVPEHTEQVTEYQTVTQTDLLPLTQSLEEKKTILRSITLLEEMLGNIKAPDKIEITKITHLLKPNYYHIIKTRSHEPLRAKYHELRKTLAIRLCQKACEKFDASELTPDDYLWKTATAAACFATLNQKNLLDTNNDILAMILANETREIIPLTQGPQKVPLRQLGLALKGDEEALAQLNAAIEANPDLTNLQTNPHLLSRLAVDTFTHIRNVTIGGDIHEVTWQRLVTKIQHNRSIKELNLSDRNLNQKECALLIRNLLKHNASIENIKLYIQLDEKYRKRLQKLIQRNTRHTEITQAHQLRFLNQMDFIRAYEWLALAKKINLALPEGIEEQFAKNFLTYCEQGLGEKLKNKTSKLLPFSLEKLREIKETYPSLSKITDKTATRLLKLSLQNKLQEAHDTVPWSTFKTRYQQKIQLLIAKINKQETAFDISITLRLFIEYNALNEWTRYNDHMQPAVTLCQDCEKELAPYIKTPAYEVTSKMSEKEKEARRIKEAELAAESLAMEEEGDLVVLSKQAAMATSWQQRTQTITTEKQDAQPIPAPQQKSGVYMQ